MPNTRPARPLFADNERIAVRAIGELIPLIDEDALALPPIQRGGVWEPRKIVELWDSVLRGLPIGSFLAYRMGEGALGRRIASDAHDSDTVEQNEGTFALFDGQQRIKALQRGWQRPFQANDLCLWVDLGQAPKDGAAFRMRVTTVGRPFGYAKDFAGRWTLAQTREAVAAYEAWLEARPDTKAHRPGGMLEFFGNPDWRPAPWQASPFVLPLSELIDLCERSETSDLLEEATKPWRRSLVDSEPIKGNADGLQNERLATFCQALKRALALPVAIQLVDEDVIGRPTERQRNDVGSKKARDGEALTDLFQRIGQNGARLSDADLAFSMIKQTYPWAHDAVRDIYHGRGKSGTPVGAMLDQTEIVLLAMRVARMVSTAKADGGRANVTIPGPQDVDAMLESSEFKLLLPNSKVVGERSLSSLLQVIVEGLAHRGDDDIGLPRPSFAFFDFDLISILTLWAFQTSERLDLTVRVEGSREELLRFVLWWRLCVFDRPRAGRTALEWLLADLDHATDPIFPGGDLYWHLIDTRSEKGEWVGLPTPSELPFAAERMAARKEEWTQPSRKADRLFGDGTPWLRDWHERFGHPDDIAAALAVNGEHGLTDYARNKPEHDRVVADTFWHAVGKGREDILIWLQRAYVARKFGDYDPLALHENDKPYDLDHISPRSHSTKGGRRRSTWRNDFTDVDDEVFERFHDHSWATTNAIGNYRVLSLDDNRRDGAKSVKAKMTDPDGTLSPQGAADSVMPEGWEGDWSVVGSSASTDQWTADRIAVFQRAIERRGEHLYGRFYNDLGFDVWTRRH